MRGYRPETVARESDYDENDNGICCRLQMTCISLEIDIFLALISPFQFSPFGTTLKCDLATPDET